MTFDEFNNTYHDLIFAPLSYKVPDIDINKLVKWANANRDLEYKMVMKNNPSLTDEDFKKGHTSELAFVDSFFLLTGYPGKNSQWFADFDKEFPEFVEFVDSMPIEGEPHFGFILQKPYNEIADFNPHRVSHIHADELGGYGIRMYVNSTKNRMYFYGLKENTLPEYIKENYSNSKSNLQRYHELENGKPTYSNNGLPKSNKFFYDTPVKTSLKAANQVFFINGVKAVHFIQHEETDSKLTFLIMGRQGLKERYNWGKIANSIEEARITQSDEFIYYNDLRD